MASRNGDLLKGAALNGAILVGALVFLWGIFESRLVAHEAVPAHMGAVQAQALERALGDLDKRLEARDRDIQRQLDEIRAELRKR